MHKKYTYFVIPEQMTKHNETQMEVSELLGITDMTLRYKLAGKRDWTIGEIETLCQHYKMDYYELFRKE